MDWLEAVLVCDRSLSRRRTRACVLATFGCAIAVAPIANASDGWAIAAASEMPRGTYVRVPASPIEGAPAQAAEGGEPHILYLNRCAGSVTISAGWPDDNTVNRSGILGGSVTFPPYPYGDASWNEVVEHTRQIFSPFNVAVTDVDPSPTPHDEAIVCGSGSMAGFGGAGGVSPFTCDVIPAPITFTFPESLGDYPRSIAEVIAQEAAHAWGLEHEYKCEDPMSYLYGCGDKTFQDGEYECGEYSPRACDCGGSTQNSYQTILALFGSAVPDLQEPTAVVTHPHDGDTFAVGEDFDISVSVSDDVGIERVSLFVDGALSSEDASDPFGPWPVLDIPEGSYEVYIVATDAAGKTTTSEVVAFDVTADGGGAAGTGEGSDGGDLDEGGAGDDGDGDDGEDDGGASDGEGAGGALPPGFGLNGEAPGCACRGGVTPPGPIVLLGLVLALRRRRR